MVNGDTQTGAIALSPDATYDVEISRPGYKTYREQAKRPSQEWSFTLSPEPLRLTLVTAEKTGKILIDNKDKGELQDPALQDLELPTDENEHLVTVRSRNREALSFSYTAKPGETPHVTALKPPELIVVSGLANEAIAYSGSTTLSAGLAGQELKTIPPEGLKLSVVMGANNELVFSAKDLPTVLIETGNSPTVYVGLSADTNIAHLRIQSSIQTARLSVDGVERRVGKSGKWRIELKPGTYRIALAAEGYEDYQEQVVLAKGQTIAKSIELKPKTVVMVTTTWLIIEGGTPGAEVLVDGATKGTLDSLGSAKLEVTPESHKISFRKQYFEPSSEISRVFSRGDEIRLGPNEAKLKEFGTLQFKITPADAQVSFGRVDQREVLQHARGRDSRQVAAGRYVVKAEAAGYVAQENNYNVISGQPALVEFALNPEAAHDDGGRGGDNQQPKFIFENPAQVQTTLHGWMTSNSSAEYVFLKAGIDHPLDLAFLPSKRAFGRQKKVEWVVNYVNGKQKVVYEFDGKKLTRKAVADGKSAEESTMCAFGEDSYQFTVNVQPHQVVVKSSHCGKAVSYTSEKQDLTQGKIGIKPNTMFMVQ
jgi:hypothetical protein